MSCEERNVKKKRCVEKGDSESQAPTGNAPTNSQPCGAPIRSFRDLIFSVSGTMPAAENSEMEQSKDKFGGKRKLDDGSDDEFNAIDKDKPDEAENKEAPIVNESDVGITEYVSAHQGFSGILKQR